MASYPLYSVEDCSTFLDFLIRINAKFGDSIAFRSKQDCWTYRDFYHEVLGLLPPFPKNAHYFYAISVTSPYKFAAVYFSVIISGNVAVLADGENLEKLNIQEELHMINDENICNFYCKKEQVQLEEYIKQIIKIFAQLPVVPVQHQWLRGLCCRKKTCYQIWLAECEIISTPKETNM